MAQFQIRDLTLAAELDPRNGGSGFRVKSIPRPYSVDWLSDVAVDDAIESLIRGADHPIIYIDRKVRDIYFRENTIFDHVPVLEVDSSENLKTLDGALALIAFLDQEKATKSSMLIVIGGGIIQDVAGFSCCIYKRGIPWTYVPTTFLAQGDSGMGGKAGLNYQGAKNILALFSAPRRVVIHTGFLETLNKEDILSGLGEVYRLHVTGGEEFLALYEAGMKRFWAGDMGVLNDLLVSALAVKRAVIEEDEFETDIRRAMNYGHSMGHALESLTGHAIPHGTAVVVGMLIENEISHDQGLLSNFDRNRLQENARHLITDRVRGILKEVDLTSILDVLGRDKKSEGKILKLALLKEIGRIDFVDFPLVPDTQVVIRVALETIRKSL